MKKMAAILLALLMVLPVVLSCQNGEKKPEETTGAQSGQMTETEDPFDDKVPKMDLKEYEFLIAAPNPGGDILFDNDEESSDAVQDALYRRNRILEDRFNITITSMNLGWTNSQAPEFARYAQSGEDTIDMIGVGIYQSGKPMITSGYAMPWNDVSYINLEKPWWNKSVTETLSLFGNYYYLSGDINWPVMQFTMAFFFNKDVAQTYQNICGDIYQTVRDGDWTQERLLNICKQLSTDNGDGKWDENDTYGLIQYYYSIESYVYGADYQTVTIEEDGVHMNINTEKMAKIVDYAYKLICENNLSFMAADDATIQGIFFDNRALFFNGDVARATFWRAFDTDFGIIPNPKYDKAQKDYKTYSDQWGMVLCLPSTASDLERTGAIVEAMAALSRKYITPAYYEKTLLGKVKRDDESEEMLDIIFSNVLYDTGISFCSDLSYIPLRALVYGKSRELTSWYRMYSSVLEKNYGELYEYALKKAAE